MNKEEKRQLTRLYEMMDGVADYEASQQEPDVVKLQQLATQKQVVDSLDEGSEERAHAYNALLGLAYEYYQLTGMLPTEFIPKSVDLNALIEAYHTQRADAFNPMVQTQMHNFLLSAAALLQQLQKTAQIGPTIDQYQAIKVGLNDQIQFLIEHGFALDLEVYRTEIAPAWLPMKMSRKLTAGDFKPLFKVLDRYTRLETGNEQNVTYHADEAHTAKKEEPKAPTPEQEQRQARTREKQASRLNVQTIGNGQVVVKLPSLKQRNDHE